MIFLCGEEMAHSGFQDPVWLFVGGYPVLVEEELAQLLTHTCTMLYNTTVKPWIRGRDWTCALLRVLKTKAYSEILLSSFWEYSLCVKRKPLRLEY